MTKKNIFLWSLAIMFFIGFCLLIWVDRPLSHIAYNAKVESISGQSQIIITGYKNQPNCLLHDAIFKIKKQLIWCKILLFFPFIILLGYTSKNINSQGTTEKRE